MLEKALGFLQNHRLGTYVLAISSVVALYIAEETKISYLNYDVLLLETQIRNEKLKRALD